MRRTVWLAGARGNREDMLEQEMSAGLGLSLARGVTGQLTWHREGCPGWSRLEQKKGRLGEQIGILGVAGGVCAWELEATVAGWVELVPVREMEAGACCCQGDGGWP